jgi:hypothetical protein
MKQYVMVNDATDSIEIFSELTSTIPLETTQVGMSIYEITPVSPPNATIGMKYNGGSLQPEEGDFIAFPAWLYHSVTPSESLSPRISIASNYSVQAIEEL